MVLTEDAILQQKKAMETNFEYEMEKMSGCKPLTQYIVIDEVKEEKGNKINLFYKNKNSKKKDSVYVNYSTRVLENYLNKWVEVVGVIDKDGVWRIKNIRDMVIAQETDTILKKYFEGEELEVAQNVMDRLSKNQREDLMDALQNRTQIEEDIDKKELGRFISLDELRNKYVILRNTYPVEIRDEIEHLFSEVKHGVGTDRNIMHKVLRHLVNVRWNEQSNREYDYDKIKNAMDSEHYGHREVKEQLIQLIRNHSERTQPQCIVLNGPSGIGKSTLLYEMFRAMGIPYTSIPLGGKTDEWPITGTSRVYENSKPGRIAMGILKNGFNSAFIFDEIDKVGKEVEAALLDVLWGRYSDNNWEVPIDLSQAWLFATSNDISKMSEALFDRCIVINVQEYYDAERIEIAKRHVIPDCNLRYDMNLTFSAEALRIVVEDFCLTSSIRELSRNFETIYQEIRKRNKKLSTLNKQNLMQYCETITGAEKRATQQVRELGALKQKFIHYRRRYTEETQHRCLELFKQIESRELGQALYAKDALYYLVNILPNYNERENEVTLHDVAHKLEKTHGGMESVKKEILKRFAADQRKGNNEPFILLLEGTAGIGKTTIAKSIAEAMGKPLAKVSLDGVSDTFTVAGAAHMNRGAEAGIIAKELVRVQTTECILLLDEFDKMQCVNGKNPYSVFHSLFDKEGMFEEYLETHIAFKNTIIFITCNDISRIPATLLDRMSVMHMNGYTRKEKKDILKHYIIPKTNENYGVNLKYTDTAVSCLVENCSCTSGVRQLERIVDDICATVIFDDVSKGEEAVTIDRKFVEKYIEEDVNEFEFSAEQELPSGVAKALAVAGNDGDTFAIEVAPCYMEPDGQLIRVTGLAKGSCLESIAVVSTLVCKYMKQQMPTLHLHFTKGGIPKDGSSAGLCIYVAVMSYLTQRSLPNVAFTGELDVLGFCRPIGGCTEKLNAAERANIERVYVPEANYQRLVKDNALERYNLEVVPVSHVSQLNEEFFDIEFDVLEGERKGVI